MIAITPNLIKFPQIFGMLILKQMALKVCQKLHNQKKNVD